MGIKRLRDAPRFATGLRLRTAAKTANYTVTSGESGTIFNNQGVTKEVVFTLPVPADGLFYIFANMEDQNLVIAADASGNMVAFNDVAANQIALNTSNEKAGGAFLVWSDGAQFHVGEWMHDAQTATIAT